MKFLDRAKHTLSSAGDDILKDAEDTFHKAKDEIVSDVKATVNAKASEIGIELSETQQELLTLIEEVLAESVESIVANIPPPPELVSMQQDIKKIRKTQNRLVQLAIINDTRTSMTQKQWEKRNKILDKFHKQS